MEQRNPKSTIPHIVNPYVEESKPKTGRFLTLSVFIHAAMVATVALMSFPPPEIMKADLIEIEMVGDGDLLMMPDGAEAPGSAGMLDTSNGAAPEAEVAKVIPAEPIQAAVQAPPAPPEPAPVPVKSAAPPTSAPKAVAPVAPKPAPVATKPAAPKPVAQKPAPPAPSLETSETGEVPVSQIDEADMQDDFERIDQSHQNSLAAAKQAQEEEAAKEAAEARQQALAEARRDEEAKAVAAAEQARREKEAQALATAKAAEQAARMREARAQERAQAEARARDRAAAEAQAAREARAAADAQAAKEAEASRAAQAAAAAAAASQASAGKAASGDQGEGSGSGQGAPEGNGNSDSPEPTKQVAGIPGGVRSLGQLRQRPGNRSPQYEPRERLARQEGSVIFYAYVNKDGSLSGFKQEGSTGYTNLDSKTLDALKRWKFYPGQEGWVEMPFQWSLRGDAQEAGGLLR